MNGPHDRRPRDGRAPSTPSGLRAVAASLTMHAAGLGLALAATGSLTTRQSDWAASSAATPAESSLWRDDVAPIEAPAVATAPAVTIETAAFAPLEFGSALPELDPYRADADAAAAEAADADLDRAPSPPPPPQWLAALRRVQPEHAGEPATAAATPTANVAPENLPAAPPTAPSSFVQASPLPGTNAPPRYPFVAWRHGIEGTVVVILEIAADGSVRAANVETSSGSSMLDDAALQTLSNWRFEPARDGNRAMRGTWRQVVVFRLDAATGQLGS